MIVRRLLERYENGEISAEQFKLLLIEFDIMKAPPAIELSRIDADTLQKLTDKKTVVILK
jgi:hypothetical protein